MLKCLHYCSIVNLLPVQVDAQAWDLRPGADTRVKLWVSYVSYGLFLCHALYKNLLLAYTLIFLRSEIPLHQLLIHADLAAFSLMICFYYYVIHLACPGLNASLMRMTLTANVVGGEKSGLSPLQNMMVLHGWFRDVNTLPCR